MQDASLDLAENFEKFFSEPGAHQAVDEHVHGCVHGQAKVADIYGHK